MNIDTCNIMHRYLQVCEFCKALKNEEGKCRDLVVVKSPAKAQARWELSKITNCAVWQADIDQVHMHVRMRRFTAHTAYITVTSGPAHHIACPALYVLMIYLLLADVRIFVNSAAY